MTRRFARALAFLACGLTAAACGEPPGIESDSMVGDPAASDDPSQVERVSSAIADGTYSCRNIGNGDLCVRFINGYSGVDIWYHKRAGAPVRVRFSYAAGNFTHYDDGDFVQHAGEIRTYAWNGTNPGGCVVGFINPSGQSRIPSNTICPD
jgi:hypothetical protein